LFIGILFSCFSSSEGKQGQNEKYQNSKIHYLNSNDGHVHVHENKQSLNGHHSLKYVMKFKKNKLKKVQNTIRIGIDFINNGKPFKVSSKRSKMLTEIKSNTKQLNSKKKRRSIHLHIHRFQGD
jgi:adenylyl- and sulfurtransferase ThiI